MSTMTMNPTAMNPTAMHPTEMGPMPTRSGAARPAAARLTRRGRLVVFLAALAAVLCLGIVLGAGSVASERPGTPEPTRVVMVGSGETLWAIASELTEGGDVRAMVDRIERLNALDTAMVTAGQRLRVPLQQ